MRNTVNRVLFPAIHGRCQMSGDDKEPETPSEAVLLFAMMAIVLGGTILINLIIYAIFPEISG